MAGEVFRQTQSPTALTRQLFGRKSLTQRTGRSWGIPQQGLTVKIGWWSLSASRLAIA
jgi:hypothetical protein